MKNKGYTVRHTYVELNCILLEHFRTCQHCDERDGLICTAAYELLAIITQRIGSAIIPHGGKHVHVTHIQIGEV